MRRFFWVVRDGLYHGIVGNSLHATKAGAKFILKIHNDHWLTPAQGYIERVEIRRKP